MSQLIYLEVSAIRKFFGNFADNLSMKVMVNKHIARFCFSNLWAPSPLFGMNALLHPGSWVSSFCGLPLHPYSLHVISENVGG